MNKPKEITIDGIVYVPKQYNDKPKQVELEGGEWYVDVLGKISKFASFIGTRSLGVEFKTKELAEKALVDMRRTNRLRNLAYQLDPDYVDDNNKDEEVYFIELNSLGTYIAEWNMGFRTLGTVYMSKQTSITICQLLNDKLFDLDGIE